MNDLVEKSPFPDMDSERITLAHGSGGKLTNRLLDNGVFKLFDNDKLQKRDDGAVFNMNGDIAFSTDSFVISPIFFPGGDIGELAVNGTVNDVAMTGGIPKYISLAFIIEEGMLVSDLWKILLSIKSAADKSGVQIVTGDTKVVEKGHGDQIFINTTGVGEMHPKAELDMSKISTGDKIIISGNVANHGIAILSKREGLEFESEIESDTVNLNYLVKEILDKHGSAVKLFRDPTRGGVATVLNEIAIQTKTGISINSDEIPVEKQVNGACELFGLDPLYVANEGIMITIVDPSEADKILSTMQNLPEGVNSKIIGEITSEHIGKVVSNGIFGGARVVSMPIAEQLPRIC
ncbi:MAG: hydrogenase expression/formation protein HypE [Bacteroidota bacterium]